ncbi:MAG: twin-arginine translocation signal domain-containing protein, partial [Comamonadaceae bacterium]|nr:twin-arginine translocation signal domain-containing protein [Comamonadaceae bacterium]
MHRRHFLHTSAAAASTLALGGCPAPAPPLPGGFAGIDIARGHQVRDLLARGPLPAPAST